MGIRCDRQKARTSLGRRDFMRGAGLGALAAALGRRGARAASRATSPRVAFCSANLVARVSGYRFELDNWMDQHHKTIAATDESEWRRICEEVAAAGFEAIEVWEAHASAETLTSRARAAEWRKALEDTGLKPVAYAGGLRRETLEICEWLGIPHVDGRLRGQTPGEATALCQEFGVRFNLENHPEGSAKEILDTIGGGNEWLGVCIDTGWLGTQGASGPDVIEACGGLVRHTHIKDVEAVGGHATCLRERAWPTPRPASGPSRTSATKAGTRGRTSPRTATPWSPRCAIVVGSRSG